MGLTAGGSSLVGEVWESERYELEFLRIPNFVSYACIRRRGTAESYP
jgi:hypothetical protein